MYQSPNSHHDVSSQRHPGPRSGRDHVLCYPRLWLVNHLPETTDVIKLDNQWDPQDWPWRSSHMVRPVSAHARHNRVPVVWHRVRAVSVDLHTPVPGPRQLRVSGDQPIQHTDQHSRRVHFRWVKLTSTVDLFISGELHWPVLSACLFQVSYTYRPQRLLYIRCVRRIWIKAAYLQIDPLRCKRNFDIDGFPIQLYLI